MGVTLDSIRLWPSQDFCQSLSRSVAESLCLKVCQSKILFLKKAFLTHFCRSGQKEGCDYQTWPSFDGGDDGNIYVCINAIAFVVACFPN